MKKLITLKYGRTLIAIIAAFVLSNLLTTLWYMLSDEANNVAFRREEMNYLGLVLNHLIFAILFVVLFQPFYEKSNKIGHGIKVGILLGALMFVPTGIVVRSIWKVEFNTIFILNSLAHMIIAGIIGATVCLIYNYKNISL